MTKLASTLPTGDKNGLVAITGDLLNDPHNAHLAVALISTKQITTDTDTAVREATIRIDRIEVITDPEDVATVEGLVRRAMEERIGDAIPFEDMRDDLDEEFSRVTLSLAPEHDDQGDN
jgi:hypothetical protein